MVASLSTCLARFSIITFSYGQYCFVRVHLLYQKTDSMPYAAKAKSQQFTRRKANLVKKADQLARLCHADLALIIRKNGRYYTYRSTDHDRWPPTITEIVGKDLTDIWVLRWLELRTNRTLCQSIYYLETAFEWFMTARKYQRERSRRIHPNRQG